MPSGIVGNVHVPVVDVATNVQVTGEPEAGVAVKVTVAPTASPAIVMSGELSLVILSVDEVPKSEADERASVVGAATVPTFTVRKSVGVPGVVAASGAK